MILDYVGGPRCHHNKRYYKREAEGNVTQNGGVIVTVEVEIGVIWPQAMECWQTPEAERDQEGLLP